jgi:hypothetical protein
MTFRAHRQNRESPPSRQTPVCRCLKLLFLALIMQLATTPVCAWNDPVHRQITTAAIMSVPARMRNKLSPEAENLIKRYCLYPDIYGNPESSAEQRAPIRKYCVKPDGKPVHNVTWQRDEDLDSLEYVLRGIIDSLRDGKIAAAAQYAGVLAHFLEDSTCPGHAFIPMDGPLNFMKELLPPPPAMKEIRLHPFIEASAPQFTLRGRVPQLAGRSVPEAAGNLLDQTYAVIRYNRAHLVQIVQAVYAKDNATLNGYRLKAEVAGAKLLADAYYTAFILEAHAK